VGVIHVIPRLPDDVVNAFDEHLTRFAEISGLPGLSPIIDRLRRPTGVAVVGRTGVGRDTVAAALRLHGVAVTGTGTAEVRVVVIAEAVKPEECAMAVGLPTLVVLNKADLTGTRCGGAWANAHRRAADVQRRTGTPTVAMVGLLGKASGASEATGDMQGALDADLVHALRTLVSTPADLASVDAFVACDHPIGREVRSRLLERLDRFGIAHAVVALARGDDPATLPALLLRLSNVEAVLAGLRACAAPVRYRRLRAALAEMHALAIELDDEGLLGLLNSEAAVPSTHCTAAAVPTSSVGRCDCSTVAGEPRHRGGRAAIGWGIQPRHRTRGAHDRPHGRRGAWCQRTRRRGRGRLGRRTTG
jgi:hypothetical protein